MLENKKLEKRIRNLVDYYSRMLGLNNYKIDILFDGYENLECNYAEVFKQPDHREATIKFNLEKLTKESEEVDKTVIHELFHIILWPIRHRYINISENYITDVNSRDFIKDEYLDDEHEFIFSMEDVISKYAKGDKDSEKMGRRKSRRKSNSSKKDIQKTRGKK
jgi:hypothetical protein